MEQHPELLPCSTKISWVALHRFPGRGFQSHSLAEEWRGVEWSEVEYSTTCNLVLPEKKKFSPCDTSMH